MVHKTKFSITKEDSSECPYAKGHPFWQPWFRHYKTTLMHISHSRFSDGIESATKGTMDWQIST
jgi:hypothetical protein